MSYGKTDPVPPPPGPGEYDVRFSTLRAAEGWKQLCKQASGNALAAWKLMRTNPSPNPCTKRHDRLKGPLSTAVRNGRAYPQWQIEVTGGGRLWYLLDSDRQTVWLREVHIGHPKKTE
ncbi:hypothetical protein [Streptomyces sp. NPDC056987]|uniref:hypothetical protein n=1 Tax=Streptomyces sp. NPDC056987 TaxID=3345988 RepID=UPI00362EA9F2